MMAVTVAATSMVMPMRAAGRDLGFQLEDLS